MTNLLAGTVQNMNTLAIDAYCPNIIEISSLEQLVELSLPDQAFYILGEGSNTLFTDNTTPTLLLPRLKGIEVHEAADHYFLKVAAGENWHRLVEYTVANNMPGLENLALIPGSVGAAPVQNIGAYGVELADLCHSLDWFEFDTKRVKTLTAKQCQFGYRDSVFKRELKGKGLITSVTFALPKQWQPRLNYAGLNQLDNSVTASEVIARVVSIRNSKLPNPAELANAGSFFKNPVVSQALFEQLSEHYPELPHFPQANHQVKLAAGWLIEQAGLKGYRLGDAGIHEQQALVLVNFGTASGQEIAELAKLVIAKVAEKFSVELVPEVRLIGANGETSLSAELSHV